MRNVLKTNEEGNQICIIKCNPVRYNEFNNKHRINLIINVIINVTINVMINVIIYQVMNIMIKVADKVTRYVIVI